MHNEISSYLLSLRLYISRFINSSPDDGEVKEFEVAEKKLSDFIQNQCALFERGKNNRGFNINKGSFRTAALGNSPI